LRPTELKAIVIECEHQRTELRAPDGVTFEAPCEVKRFCVLCAAMQLREDCKTGKLQAIFAT
jgi:hypothetical protein